MAKDTKETVDEDCPKQHPRDAVRTTELMERQAFLKRFRAPEDVINTD